MGGYTIANIRRGRVVVKSNNLAKPQESQSSTDKKSSRPDVLSKMPRSCNIVFDVLRDSVDSRGQVMASTRYLAQVTRLSPQSVYRALHRLRGANLIAMASPSRGTTPCTWEVRWRVFRGAFPQFCVTPRPIRNNPENLCLLQIF